MSKTSFKYQKWFLRIFCGGIGLPLVFAIQCLCAELMGIKYANFRYALVCIVVTFVWIYVYYKFTQRRKLFECTGKYWAEKEIVYIQKGKHVYEVENVEWLRGTTVSVYGLSRSGMLIIKFKKKKITFISSSVDPVENFSDSELFPLFNFILEHNPKLTKDDTLDFWYEIK